MQGVVKKANNVTGIFAVSVGEGVYSVVEFDGDYDIETDDVITGDLDSDGQKFLVNETQSIEMEAVVQFVGCTFAQALLHLK